MAAANADTNSKLAVAFCPLAAAADAAAAAAIAAAEEFCCCCCCCCASVDKVDSGDVEDMDVAVASALDTLGERSLCAAGLRPVLLLVGSTDW